MLIKGPLQLSPPSYHYFSPHSPVALASIPAKVFPKNPHVFYLPINVGVVQDITFSEGLKSTLPSGVITEPLLKGSDTLRHLE